MSGKMLPEKGQKDENTSTGCWKGAGSLVLCLRATGETNNHPLGETLANLVTLSKSHILNSGFF
jgi:hypothetical protein